MWCGVQQGGNTNLPIYIYIYNACFIYNWTFVYGL